MLHQNDNPAINKASKLRRIGGSRALKVWKMLTVFIKKIVASPISEARSRFYLLLVCRRLLDSCNCFAIAIAVARATTIYIATTIAILHYQDGLGHSYS